MLTHEFVIRQVNGLWHVRCDGRLLSGQASQMGALRVAEALPDLIISDVIMPDMNGIEAAIRIRQLLPGCKILLFSGQAATAELLEKARQEGHEFEILAKPVHPQDLLAQLRG